jgi:hypothetical protein
MELEDSSQVELAIWDASPVYELLSGRSCLSPGKWSTGLKRPEEKQIGLCSDKVVGEVPGGWHSRKKT